jgi:ferredoxin
MKRKRRLSLIKPATAAFIREARRTPDYSFFDWLHGYVYARWPYLYIGIGTGEHPLSRVIAPLVGWLTRVLPSLPGDGPTFADTYHGKVVPVQAATQLVTIDEEITLTDLEKIIPYTRARDIVMQNPDHIVVIECPCRAARPNPCKPLDVCLIIGEPFAGLVAEHHPERSRWITPQEAVEILQAEDERGHVHHAFFKDAMLQRFYAICNCCACCCGAMQAHQHGTPMLASSGYVAQVDVDLCIGCGVCAGSCQFSALSVDEGVAVVDDDACMGCGVCVAQCPQGALSLLREPGKGEPLEIQRLLEAAAGATEKSTADVR